MVSFHGAALLAQGARMRAAPQSGLAAVGGETVHLLAGPKAPVRRVVITVNAATAVTAGSRFEARSAEVLSSGVNGLSATGERLRLHCDTAIQTVHAAQLGAVGYVDAIADQVPANQMGVWRFDVLADVRTVEVLIGPSADGGLSLPVTCLSPAVPPAPAARGRA